MKIKTILVIIFVYLLLKIFLFYFQNKNYTRLVFYDVGQGDAALISTDDKKMLIDGGPDFKISSLLANEFILNTCALDYVLLTHPHADHLKGLTRAINNCKIGKLLFNEVEYDSKLYKGFLSEVVKLDYREVFAGDTFDLGKFKIYVFWPQQGPFGDLGNVNNTSVVLLLDYGNFEALFTGDLEKEYLSKLDYKEMQKFIQNGLDVLKVPHHGSVDSLDESLYTNLHPKTCVISAGKNNKYGHPDVQVINFLKKSDCKIRRTDLEGTIEILVD